MSKPARHELDIYLAVLHAAATRKQWAHIRREVDTLDEDPGSLAVTNLAVFEVDAGGSIPHVAIYVDRKGHRGNTAALVNSVAHESDHAAGMLLDHFGESYDGASEAHAYLVGWIAQWLWDHIDRKG